MLDVVDVRVEFVIVFEDVFKM